MKSVLPLRAALLAGLATISIPLSFSRADAPPASTAPAGTVLVLPFSAPSEGKIDWVGKAVQQDLLTDLSQATVTRALAPAGLPPAVDAQAALQTAREQGASIVVYGQAQVAGNEVRLTGQVLDVSSGNALGALKATGSSDQLFHLEDALAGQMLGAMPKTSLSAQTLHAMQEPNAGSSQQGNIAQATPPGNACAMPTDVSPQEAYLPQSYYGSPDDLYYAQPDTGAYYPNYTYSTPDLDWWPYWSSGIIIGGFGFGHFHHDHGGYHHWGDRWGSSNGSRGFASVGRGFTGTGFARMSVSPGAAAGGFHVGVARGASIGGFRGSGGFHAAAGGFHGGGGGGHR